MLLDFCAMLRIKRMNESKVAKNMLHKYCTAALSTELHVQHQDSLKPNLLGKCYNKKILFQVA